MQTLSFPIVTIAALLDSINPCALSVLLLTIAFLFSLGKARGSIIRIGLIYILGIFIVYLLIGLGVLQALTFFGVPKFVGKIGAVILIAFGALDIVQGIFPKFPIQFSIPKSAHPKLAVFIEKGSIPAALILGGLVALYEFPCTGGPYLFILGLLHDAGTYVSGFAWLMLYNIVFVAPLVIVLMIASSETLYRKFETWKKGNMKKAGFAASFGMIILGFIIFFL
ncbi:MAG: cytochrome c biogenesis protein CcdA [Patescibacteria group bacterium]